MHPVVKVHVPSMKDNYLSFREPQEKLEPKWTIETTSVCLLVTSLKGTGIAQLVEPATKKPGAILTRVRVPGTARDFLPESTFSADSLKLVLNWANVSSRT